MIETVLFDADGVVIAKRQKYFTQRLVDDFGVSPEEAMDFVKNGLSPAMKGKGDLRSEFPEYLLRWKINKSVDEMFDYWWSAENKVDNEVLSAVDELRKKGLDCYLVSDQEKNRGIYIMTEMGLGKHFDGAFMSYDLGFQKQDIEFWQKILEQLKTQDPSKVLYWDDDQKNVDSAQNLGIVSRLYSNFDDFQKEIKNLGII